MSRTDRRLNAGADEIMNSQHRQRPKGGSFDDVVVVISERAPANSLRDPPSVLTRFHSTILSLSHPDETDSNRQGGSVRDQVQFPLSFPRVRKRGMERIVNYRLEIWGSFFSCLSLSLSLSLG